MFVEVFKGELISSQQSSMHDYHFLFQFYFLFWNLGKIQWKVAILFKVDHCS